MKAPTPAKSYPKGFFTQPVHARTKACPAGFPPRWVSELEHQDWRAQAAARLSSQATTNRERNAVAGTGWGTGQVHGMGAATALGRLPEVMKRGGV